MFHCIKRTPQILFHFTPKTNVDNIRADRCIKHSSEDDYTWFFENFDNAVQYFEKFLMADDHYCLDRNRIPHYIPYAYKEDYVILKLTPKYDNPMEWFHNEIIIPPHIPIEKVKNPYENSVAYRGNLQFKDIEVLSIP